MKPVNKFLLTLGTLALAFTACQDVIEREASPEIPENCQQVAFYASSGSINNAAYEVEPTAAKEIVLSVSRVKTDEAVSVPITVVVNDSSIFTVPASVDFAAGQDSASFTVTFPNAEEGITYNLRLELQGDEFVSPYLDQVTFFETSATVIAWVPATEPAIMVDGFVCTFWNTPATAWYVKYEVAQLTTMTKYRLLNPYSTLPENFMPDENGIYDAYPYNEPEDVDADGTYNMTVIVDANNNATFSVFYFGMDWGYGEFYAGLLKGSTGVVTDDKITFPASSCGVFMGDEYGAYSGQPQIIYLTLDAYLADNRAIKDYNEVEYETIPGAISEFVSAWDEAASWDQLIQKAIDIDPDNEESDYKGLFYLPDLYAEGYGLAFYYNETTGKITIPAAQSTGIEVFGSELYMSATADVASTKETSAKGVDVYTFNLTFHYEDGTVLGDRQEVFYWSENAVAFGMDDFCGDFVMTGPSLWASQGEPDANMEVNIAKCGQNNDSLVITGIDFTDAIYASFDATAGIMHIASAQECPNYGQYDITFYTINDNSMDEDLEFSCSMTGKLSLAPTSAAYGYVLYSELGQGSLDGYVDIVFTPVTTKSATATKAAKVPSFKSEIPMRKVTKQDSKLSVQKGRNIYKERKQHVQATATPVLF